MSLTTYADADHARCQVTRRSTSGCCNNVQILWMFCSNPMDAFTANRLRFLCTATTRLRFPYAVTMFNTHKTEYQLADIFTKPLPRDRFNFLIEKLGMRGMSPETLKRLAEETDE
ncbi:hypothetical protein Tco_0883710 [Tanacetum coccineum]